MILLTETKCKFRLIYVGFNCQGIPSITFDWKTKTAIETNTTVARPEKITVKLSMGLQRHLATIFCPDYILGNPIILPG